MASKLLSGGSRKPSMPQGGSSSTTRPAKVSTMITKPGAKGGGCGPCAAKRKGRPNG